VELIDKRSKTKLIVTSDDSIDKTLNLKHKGYMYVRICTDNIKLDRSKSEISSSVEMTRDIIKFGITINLDNRQTAYWKNNDGGYFIYAFTFDCREDAGMIENIFRYIYSDIVYEKTYEYLYTKKLAERLNVEYDESYISYVNVARMFYIQIVKTIRFVFPKYNNLNGTLYEVKERPKIIEGKKMVEVYFDDTIISDDIAKQIGIPKLDVNMYSQNIEVPLPIIEMHKEIPPIIPPLPPVTPPPPPQTNPDIQQIETLIPQPLQTEQNNEEITQDTPIIDINNKTIINNPRKSGVIISRDLFTGEIKTYKNATDAAHTVARAAASFIKNIVNCKRHCDGKIWYNEGNPFWIPPKGFVITRIQNIGEKQKPVYPDKYVKAISIADPDEQLIFEGSTPASEYLELVMRAEQNLKKTDFDRRKLADIIEKGGTHLGYQWSKIKAEENGIMTKSEQDWENRPFYLETDIPDLGVNDRCNGKISARDIETGEEKTFTSCTRVSAVMHVSAHTLKDTMLDKPRQLRGFTFRTLLADKYWQPHSNFVFQRKEKPSATNGHVVSVDSQGNSKIYHSANEAAKLTNSGIWNINQYIDTGKITQHDLKWYKIQFEECGEWIKIAPQN
jgi:hypothetical protein